MINLRVVFRANPIGISRKTIAELLKRHIINLIVVGLLFNYRGIKKYLILNLVKLSETKNRINEVTRSFGIAMNDKTMTKLA